MSTMVVVTEEALRLLLSVATAVRAVHLEAAPVVPVAVTAVIQVAAEPSVAVALPVVGKL